jgi:beta-lactamase class D
VFKKQNMKKEIYLLFLLVFVVGAPTLFSQKGDEAIKKDLSHLLDKWHMDAANSNLESYIGAMSPTGIYIGTDATENWNREQFYRFCQPYFAAKRGWEFTSLQRNLYIGSDGLVAWFDELLDTKMGVCRGSGVIQKVDGKWEIEQYVLSFTIPNELMRSVTRQKASFDTSYLLKAIFDKYDMTGTIFLLDPLEQRSMGYNSARWDSGYLPASTFKIPNSLIGLETGVVDTGYIFPWNGEKRRLPQWDKEMKLKEAFKVSCVPCYQELARKIGSERMSDYITKFGYGRMEISKENLDRFWLEGNSRITPRQQTDFLQKLHDETLPLKLSTMRQVKDIMVNEKTEKYTLYAKTGWAVRDGNNYGWFVGWVETGGKVYYFATLIEPLNRHDLKDFASIRKQLTIEVFKFFNIL